MAGGLVHRFGLRPTLWGSLLVATAGLPLLLAPSLGLVVGGMVLVSVGTFLAQAIATGYVGRAAISDRGAASGLYLAAYFAGGLVGSAILGQLFDRFGWPACVAGIFGALAVAAGLALALTPPDHPPTKTETTGD
jgi:MFS family permease